MFVLAIVAVLAVCGYGVHVRGWDLQLPAVAAQQRPEGVPPVSSEEGDRPLGVVAVPLTSSAAYRFLYKQLDESTPVTYDPCRPVHYTINPAGQPDGGARVIAAAFAELARATGLKFVDDGPTAEVFSSDREAYQPARYGKRWAPVLISWQTPGDNPDFAADVAGQAGSMPVSWNNHPRVYATGTVQLDADKFVQLLSTPAGARIARAITLHELGHLVGLGHVDDPKQIMFPSANPGVVEYASGDLAGLARLGQGPCAPWL